MSNNYVAIDERICPVCGKHFAMRNSTQWVYSLYYDQKKHHFCCYTCYRAMQKELDKKKKKYRTKYNFSEES